MNFSDFHWFMTIALEEAYKAYSANEVPIGAVLVSPDGKLISQGHNLKERDHDSTSHAELSVIQAGGIENKNWRLTGHTLFVTLEPCPMCLNAMIHARIERLVFAAYDPKGGALSLNYNFYKDKRLNHSFNVIGGIKHYESSKIISQFFREKRRLYKQNN